MIHSIVTVTARQLVPFMKYDYRLYFHMGSVSRKHIFEIADRLESNQAADNQGPGARDMKSRGIVPAIERNQMR